MTQPNTVPVQSGDFNPFDFSIAFGWLQKYRTSTLLLFPLAMVALILAATAIDGTVGGQRDFYLISDASSLFGFSKAVDTPPRFYLLRDTYSWFQAFTVATGFILLHRQWTFMSKFVSGLVTNEVIVRRPQARSGALSKVLRIDQKVQQASNLSLDPLGHIIDDLMKKLVKANKIIFAVQIVASIVLSQLLLLGQRQGLFRSLAPASFLDAGKDEWVRLAYKNWWAGQDHVAGFVTYLLLSILAILVIISFQTVGVIAVYVILAVHYTCEVRADWLNRDGAYGWSPLRDIFRTVVYCTSLLGATLANVILYLGAQNFQWIIILVLVYLILSPLFMVSPWVIFGRIQGSVRLVRINELRAELQARESMNPRSWAEIAALHWEIDRCQAIRVRPLKLTAISWGTMLLLVALPTLLTAAQIYASIKYGSSNDK